MQGPLSFFYKAHCGGFAEKRVDLTSKQKNNRNKKIHKSFADNL
jgi:hypothetical protein